MSIHIHFVQPTAPWTPVLLALMLCLSLLACDDDPSPNAIGGALAGEEAGQMMAGEAGAQLEGGEGAGLQAGMLIGGELAGVTSGGGEAGALGGASPGGAEMGGGMGDMSVCLGSSTYGLLEVPAPLPLEVEGMQSAPQLAALAEGGYLLTWLGSGEQGDNYLYSQRLNAERTPQGEPVIYGRAKGGQYRLHVTATGSVVIWINQRSELLTNESVYLQSFDLEGSPRTEAPIAVSDTFGVSYLASAWEDAFGGLLLVGSGAGLVARPFSLEGVAEGGTQLSSEAVRAPTLVFGGAGWGALWSTRDAEGAVSVSFQVLNESGEPSGELRRWEETRAQGAAKLVYGAGSYAVAWSMPDPSVLNGQGRLIINLRLMDETGGELGAFTLSDGEGSMQLSDLKWLSPSVFMAVWHTGGAMGSSVGLSRVNQQGQVLSPVIYSPEGGALLAEAKVIGAASSAQLAMTIDPSPPPTGLFSPDTRVSVTPVGPCE